ncbi:MAG: SDR family NAD(P)-dependent oxidoreductase [Chthoniobacterales bacterium]|nr:SDR family NAD(P)-dependent oxidoreductase [Chthoniobacterales bacterium]
MKTILITGASTGFGRALATEALNRGHQVALAVRNPESVADLVAQYPGKAFAIEFDLTKPADAELAVKETLEQFGRLDVLINNAGYGLLAALEESTDEQLARNLETNFTGPFRLIRAVLPVMRAQHSGHVITMSAIAAYANHPGFAVYGGAKAALDATCDAASQEAAPLGIKFTQVIPGPFRTDFIGRSLDHGARIPDYEGTVGKFGGFLSKMDGKQPGDPAKAASAILDLLDAEKPPSRLLIGGYAHTIFAKKLASMEAEMNAWKEKGQSTDFSAGA